MSVHYTKTENAVHVHFEFEDDLTQESSVVGLTMGCEVVNDFYIHETVDVGRKLNGLWTVGIQSGSAISTHFRSKEHAIEGAKRLANFEINKNGNNAKEVFGSIEYGRLVKKNLEDLIW